MLALLKAATREEISIVTAPRAQVDFEVHSVFTRTTSLRRKGWQHLKWLQAGDDGFRRWRLAQDYGIGEQGPAHRHIWYTGENLRPPAGWDVTLSFDTDPLDGSNYYLPYWAIRTSALKTHSGNDIMASASQAFTQERDVINVPTKFACVLASNPHPMRDQIARTLSEVGEVETFGRAYGRPIRSKLDLLSNYRFCITPENDVYPGYVTEKPFEAWLALTVPVWWGSDSGSYLNSEAMVDVTTTGLAPALERILAIEHSSDAWRSLASSPILKTHYDYESLVSFVSRRIQ